MFCLVDFPDFSVAKKVSMQKCSFILLYRSIQSFITQFLDRFGLSVLTIFYVVMSRVSLDSSMSVIYTLVNALLLHPDVFHHVQQAQRYPMDHDLQYISLCKIYPITPPCLHHNNQQILSYNMSLIWFTTGFKNIISWFGCVG